MTVVPDLRQILLISEEIWWVDQPSTRSLTISGELTSRGCPITPLHVVLRPRLLVSGTGRVDDVANELEFPGGRKPGFGNVVGDDQLETFGLRTIADARDLGIAESAELELASS